MRTNVWDELSRRFYGADRNFLKRAMLKAVYGGETDPWLDHMLRQELHNIEEELDRDVIRREAQR